MKLCYYIFFSLTILSCSITPSICGPGFFGPLQFTVISLFITNLGNLSPLYDIISSTLPLKASQVLGISCIYSLRESEGFYHASGHAHAPSACFPKTLQTKMHPWYRQLEVEKLQSANNNRAFTPILTKSTSTWAKISLLQPGPGASPHRSWTKFMLKSCGKYFTF